MNKWKKIAEQQGVDIAYLHLQQDEDKKKIKDLADKNRELESKLRQIEEIIHPRIRFPWYGSGGTAGQVLTKTDGGTDWVTINYNPKGYL